MLTAIDTGRSEPLFIVRDQLRNYLADTPALSPPSITDREEVPAGFVLVPREPTIEMLQAVDDIGLPGGKYEARGIAVSAYKTMLAASPVADQDDAGGRG